MANVYDKLYNYTGNNEYKEKLEKIQYKIVKYAVENAKNVAAGHFFIIMLKNAYPINILNRLKETQEILTIFAATANPLKVILAIENDMRGVLGVMDGQEPLGIENEEDKEERKTFLRKIGYKL